MNATGGGVIAECITRRFGRTYRERDGVQEAQPTYGRFTSGLIHWLAVGGARKLNSFGGEK
jgi:hypothetical protein